MRRCRLYKLIYTLKYIFVYTLVFRPRAPQVGLNYVKERWAAASGFDGRPVDPRVAQEARGRGAQGLRNRMISAPRARSAEPDAQLGKA